MSAVSTIALAGNPNCGKTTLFNRLTGDCRHVGNWPGVTVERAEGAFRLPAGDVWVTDLPGLYSLDAHTPDERVTRDFLAEGTVDVIVNIIDASNLERSLYLTAQLLALGKPLVVALNMIDLAGPLGIRIDAAGLSVLLGCPVVPISARNERGMDDFLEALDRVVADPHPPVPQAAVPAAESERYEFVRAAAARVVRRETAPARRFSDTFDRLALSRAFGIPLFLAVMYAVFMVTVKGSAPLIDWVDTACGRLLVEWPRLLLERIGAPELLITVLADGAGAGLRAVATFLPPIFLIFVCLALLENSGYMARGAFVMDKFLRKIGLPGRAFLPLLVGFGCNVPGIFATRTLKEKRERLITLLINPFMSCSARLPVYTLFAVAFFPRHGSPVVFSLYLVGVAMAILSGLLFQKTILKGEPSHFVMELPAYQVPEPKAVLRHAWENLKGFMVRGGKVIVVAVMGLSLLNSLGKGDDGTGESWLETTGKALTPVFAPMGIEPANWPAAVGLFTGVVAKESVVGTLDALYGQMEPEAGEAHEPVTGATPHAEHGETPYAQAGVRPGVLQVMRQHFTPVSAYAYLLFVLLYVPCIATLAALRREAGWGWTLFSILYQSSVAWLAAVMFYQAATWREHPDSSRLILAGCAAAIVLMVAGLKWRRDDENAVRTSLPAPPVP